MSYPFSGRHATSFVELSIFKRRRFKFNNLSVRLEDELSVVGCNSNTGRIKKDVCQKIAPSRKFGCTVLVMERHGGGFQ
jgi:hypothetical protein